MEKPTIEELKEKLNRLYASSAQDLQEGNYTAIFNALSELEALRKKVEVCTWTRNIC